MKDVDVICQIKSDGSIIPIRIKLEDEEKQIQIFNIKRYKPPKECLQSDRGFHSLGRIPSTNMMDFECIIEIFEIEKIITLRYLVSSHNWVLIT